MSREGSSENLSAAFSRGTVFNGIVLWRFLFRQNEWTSPPPLSSKVGEHEPQCDTALGMHFARSRKYTP
eukprot:9927795-Prorocentrum_lima.AAC.1